MRVPRSVVALVILLATALSATGIASTASLFTPSAVPSVIYANARGPIELGMKFFSDRDGSVTGVRFYKGPSNLGTHTASLWSSSGQLLAREIFAGESQSGWQQVTFAAPVAITANTVYVVSYHSTGAFSYDLGFFNSPLNNSPLHALGVGNGNGVYSYGVSSTFPVSSAGGANFWVDVVFTSAVSILPPPPPPANVFSLFSSAAVPTVLNAGASGPLELGMKFTADRNGWVAGVRFYKGTRNVGAHMASLWSGTGQMLARAPFTAETAAGWQQVIFSTPVPIQAKTVYLVSYSSNGYYSYNLGFFNAPVSNPPLRAVGTGSGNGVFSYGGDGLFPTTSAGGANFWVDVIFTTAPVTRRLKFAYTANELSADISGYAIDADSGALTPLAGFPVHSGVNPVAIAVDPPGHFAFVADIACHMLRVYAINAVSGGLQELPSSPYPAGNQPNAVVVHPSGKYVYVASRSSDAVFGFSVDSNTGALAPIPGSPFAAGDFDMSITLDPAGRFAFVANYLSSDVYAYSIESGSGALKLVNIVSVPNPPHDVVVDPLGAYLYVTGSGTSGVASYAIDQNSGALTAASTSPLAAQNGAFAIAIEPSGRFAYTAGERGTLIGGYSISNNMLTALPGFPIAGALGSLQLVVDPSGKFVYFPQTGSENNVSAFRIDPATGALLPIPGSPFAAGGWPMGMAITSEP